MTHPGKDIDIIIQTDSSYNEDSSIQPKDDEKGTDEQQHPHDAYRHGTLVGNHLGENVLIQFHQGSVCSSCSCMSRCVAAKYWTGCMRRLPERSTKTLVRTIVNVLFESSMLALRYLEATGRLKWRSRE